MLKAWERNGDDQQKRANSSRILPDVRYPHFSNPAGRPTNSSRRTLDANSLDLSMPSDLHLPDKAMGAVEAESLALADQFETLCPYLLAIARREFTPLPIIDCSSASDLVQDTFLAALEQWEQFRGPPEALLGWLRAILRRKIFRERGRHRRIGAASIWKKAVELTEELPDTTAPPHVLVEQEDDRLRVVQLLQEMSELHREIIEDRLQDGTFSEIAQRHGMTADAVRKTYARAVRQLRANFEAAVAVRCAAAKRT
jgi:RNA polymerase sigma-70 factor, ECF subfamily